MIFGKIDYINLLPFHLFLKRSSLQNSFKKACEHHKATPAIINRRFQKGTVDAAFISSIESRKRRYKALDVGIVARKNVQSVLVKPGLTCKDPASATSNVLAKVLGVEGEVIIGDRALKCYVSDPLAYVDLAQVWVDRFGLPFVFGRLCVTKHHTFYKKMAQAFARSCIKIPAYIVQHYAQQRGVSPQHIKTYLTHISYTIGPKEKRGLALFLKKARAFHYR